MIKSLLTSAALGAAVFAVPAGAATLNIANGGTACESTSVFPDTSMCDVSDSDLSNFSVADDALIFAGFGQLLGYLADGEGQDALYPDMATVTLAEAATVTLTLVDPQAGFDGTFIFGSTGQVVSTSSTSASVQVAAGTYDFILDPTTPTNSDTRVASNYVLEVAAVPLPAGALLMLTGLGAFAVARRKS